MFVEEQINGSDLSLFGRSIYHAWERRALTMADGLVTTSSVLAPCLPQPPTIIPYPIEDDCKPRDITRKERIVLVGTLQPRKGIEMWIRSLNTVLRECPKATAMLIGSDTPTAPDGGSMAAHARRLLDPHVGDRFCWTGTLANEQTRNLIGESSLVVVPSVLESFSFVAAEALLAGTPVIVSDRTGIAEHVPSLRKVAFKKVEAWARAQIETLADAERAREQAIRCRAEMLEACAPSRVLSNRGQFAGRILASRPVHAPAPATVGDSLAEMAEFIAEVEAEEDRCASTVAASIAGS
jgi:glycosyltransferase involved in cell wall biosynthesis